MGYNAQMTRGAHIDWLDIWRDAAITAGIRLTPFVLQNTQNRDGKAVQAKLDELILTSKAAENCFVGVERLEEKELRNLSSALADRAQQMESGQDVEPIDISEALKDRPEPTPGNPRKPNGMPIGEG